MASIPWLHPTVWLEILCCSSITNVFVLQTEATFALCLIEDAKVWFKMTANETELFIYLPCSGIIVTSVSLWWTASLKHVYRNDGYSMLFAIMYPVTIATILVLL